MTKLLQKARWRSLHHSYMNPLSIYFFAEGIVLAGHSEAFACIIILLLRCEYIASLLLTTLYSEGANLLCKVNTSGNHVLNDQNKWTGFFIFSSKWSSSWSHVLVVASMVSTKVDCPKINHLSSRVFWAMVNSEKKYERLRNRILEGLKKNATRNRHLSIFYRIPKCKVAK